MKNTLKMYLNRNVPVNLHLLKKILFKVAAPITNRVLGLKNRHKNESCYIFGDGISIKWFDLAAFPKKPTFTLTYIPFHKQAESLNVRYCLLTEPKYFYPYFKLPYPPNPWWRNRIHYIYRRLIKDRNDLEFFVNLRSYPVLRGNNIYYLFQSINDSDFEFLQECILSREEVNGGSLRYAILLAIYMGFKDIILVGCDYTHDLSRSLHWYEKGEGILYPQPDYQRRFFDIAQKYAKITTITIEGGGSALPAMTYTEFTGKPLNFRENHEILDEKTLKLLATWPGYTIF
jgi:hypothetical protein